MTLLAQTMPEKISNLTNVGAIWLIDAARQFAFSCVNYGHSDFTWAKEMGSIHIKLPKRAGNTEIAVCCAEKYYPTLILTPYRIHVTDINKRLKERNVKAKTATLDSSYYRGRNFDDTTIIVDRASEVDPDKFNLIYAFGAKFYIFLG